MVRFHAARFRVAPTRELKAEKKRRDDYGTENRNREVVQRKKRLRFY